MYTGKIDRTTMLVLSGVPGIVNDPRGAEADGLLPASHRYSPICHKHQSHPNSHPHSDIFFQDDSSKYYYNILYTRQLTTKQASIHNKGKYRQINNYQKVLSFINCPLFYIAIVFGTPCTVVLRTYKHVVQYVSSL